MRLVFMGTPEFAVPSLAHLLSDGHEVVAVFCQPDRPKGRSRKPVPCPVKQLAIQHALPVHQPTRLRKRQWRQVIESLEPEAIVVAAYGQILSRRILDIPKYGCINVHASILPRWRGASPIHHAILHGDEQVGVSIMQMEWELDSGPVYKVSGFPLSDQVGRIELEDRLAELGADLLSEVLVELPGISPRPQDPAFVTYAPIITKAMGRIDWRSSAKHITRMIKAFEGWPGVSFSFRDTPIKLLSAICSAGEGQPGQILESHGKTLLVACGDGSAIGLLEIQPAGKKPMTADAFINGYQPRAGEVL